MNTTAALSCRSTAPRVRDAARRIGDRGIRSVAIAAIFSPLDPGHEREAAAIVARGDSRLRRHVLGRSRPHRASRARERGAPQRRARRSRRATTVAAFEQAIADSGISAPLYITQNDGTVAEAGQAMRLPVYSFASGATNSMRGAAYLSGIRRRDGRGCRRHHDRCRPDQERLPARGERGREDRRRAHAVPDAGPVLVRARRRQPRLARSRRRRAAVGRLPPDLGRARLRRHAAHRKRYRHRRGPARYRRPGKGGAS